MLVTLDPGALYAYFGGDQKRPIEFGVYHEIPDAPGYKFRIRVKGKTNLGLDIKKTYATVRVHDIPRLSINGSRPKNGNTPLVLLPIQVHPDVDPFPLAVLVKKLVALGVHPSLITAMEDEWFEDWNPLHGELRNNFVYLSDRDATFREEGGQRAIKVSRPTWVIRHRQKSIGHIFLWPNAKGKRETSELLDAVRLARRT